MNIWHQAPFVRLLIPFLTGILCGVYLPYHTPITYYCILTLLILLTGSLLIHRLNFSYKRIWIMGILLNFTLFLSGFQLTLDNTEILSATHYTKHSQQAQYAIIELKAPYQEKEKSLKVVAKVCAVKGPEKWINTSGLAMIYFKKDSSSLRLNYGDKVIIKSHFNNIPAPQNPGEFNYKQFLKFHNVYRQCYLKENDWEKTGENNGNPLLIFSINLRNSLLNILRTNNIKNDEFAVGSALLLGYEDKLDADIISAYSSTGALHVLSVSGLHVAIVYLIFNWMLFFLDKIKYGNIIKASILIIMLWLYAALTGLSPSVLRAATMLSFIIVAKAYNRNTNIYNTIAASAFLLLLINPYIIMEVGFQLSYLAVIGIIYIQPKIYAWFDINNRLLDQVWTITSVSIAAQVATFPLGLLYFHQFPNYFLLSNLIVIPISTIIVYLGVALFALSKITLVAKYIAVAFNTCVWLLNQSVKTIETWPYSLLQGISISVFETWFLYSSIGLLLYYFAKRKFNFLIIALGMYAAILCSQLIEQQQQYLQKQLIIYNVPKTSAIDFINAQSNILLTDTAFAHNESRLLFHIKHNWWDLGLKNTTIISHSIKTSNLLINKNHIQFFNKRIAIINSDEIKKGSTSTPLTIDYLIISKSPKIKIDDVLKLYHPQNIIFDSSNSAYMLKKWKEQCKALQLPYYSVSESGAFILNIDNA